MKTFQSTDHKQLNSTQQKKNTGTKEDLSKFLNFYNKSTYMGVAKTMGQKLQYKLAG
jgi:hypothetical protein